jgi:uncharacterized SAM-binding protein YcdF (DUF218 family)
MFILSKIFTAWCLPPGLFVTLFMVLCVLFIRKRYWLNGLLMFLLAGLFFASCFTPLTDRLMVKLEDEHRPLDPGVLLDGDVYVVLGGGIYHNAPDLGGEGVPTGDEMHRLAFAVRLYRIKPLPVIVASGKAFECQRSEAEVMKRLLMQMGIPGKDIFSEDTSRNTHENALGVKKVFDGMGRKRIVLITSAYHMMRSVYSFSKAGFSDILPAPTDYKTGRTCYNPINYMPSVGAFDNISTVMHEYVGMLYYALLTRM